MGSQNQTWGSISGQMEFYTHPETNIAPETVGLKDEFPFSKKASWESPRYVNFRENRRFGDFLNLILGFGLLRSFQLGWLTLLGRLLPCCLGRVVLLLPWIFGISCLADAPPIGFASAIIQKNLCLDVSENSGTSKSSILIGISIINNPF